MDSKSFVLATILNSGGTFESATKLQKLAFLSIHENGLVPFANFKWHHYGPFSRELENTVGELNHKGLITEKEIKRTSYFGDNYNIKKMCLTPKGLRVIQKVLPSINKSDIKALSITIRQYGNKPLSTILEYVYNAYKSEDF